MPIKLYTKSQCALQNLSFSQPRPSTDTNTQTQWSDLRTTGFTASKILGLSRSLREGNIIVEKSHLRAFLVAWNVLDINFPSLDATKQAKLIRDMVVRQLGAVEKEATSGDGMDTISTARTEIDVDIEEYFQKLFPERPSEPLSKANKRLVRQRQLKTLITQAEKLKKRKREEEAEDDDTATHKDGVTAISMEDDESELTMEPIALSTPEKTALTIQKLERKRKLEALGSKHKKRRYL